MIQTVKCSLLVDIKFNRGFYDALCTLNLFFCKRNFFSLAAPFRQSYCLLKRVLNGFPMCFKRVSNEFQSVSKGFPKGVTATSNPLEDALVDKTCFRTEGHIYVARS